MGCKTGLEGQQHALTAPICALVIHQMSAAQAVCHNGNTSLPATTPAGFKHMVPVCPARFHTHRAHSKAVGEDRKQDAPLGRLAACCTDQASVSIFPRALCSVNEPHDGEPGHKPYDSQHSESESHSKQLEGLGYHLCAAWGW